MKTCRQAGEKLNVIIREFLHLNAFTFCCKLIASDPTRRTWQFYESALTDHKTHFYLLRKRMKTCIKTHGKSLQKRIDLKPEDELLKKQTQKSS